MEVTECLVEYVKKQFLCGTSINKFNFTTFRHDTHYPMDVNIQKQILDNTINNPVVVKYPIRKSYQRAFLKYLINKLEQTDQEIHDELYSKYCELVSIKSKECETHYKHFLLGKQNCITLQESTNIISHGTTGLCSWQAALGLGEWCLKNMDILKGKNILELGSGIGLTGLTVISTCSPDSFTFSDCHPAVLKMLCQNIQLNLCTKQESCQGRVYMNTKFNGTQVLVVNLPWEEIEQSTINGIWQYPDVILAADVLYDSSNFDALIGGLKYFLSKNNCYAIIAATVRNTETISQFLYELENWNLYFEEQAFPDSQVFIKTDETPVRIIKICVRQ
ncbi:protein-lysine N-methyltransferase EEF2KMT [Cephus cinctus]|uniref:Protein-lysine N-methyltransferase EEF2KMT n=1 Tax=Cephus cinctus TaxID=211228 RepID=A0AAJ7FDD1_CEPCN|nr:protein-lysine N-methyltransferase EEF2KMT [Cephus cinctus]